MFTGKQEQLNPTLSDPQLAGIYGYKTEVFNKPDFPAKHDSTTDSSSNPNLRVTFTDIYENVNFEKKNASKNKHTNNYSQVVSDLKSTLKKRPKPPPKPPKKVSKKFSFLGPDVDIIDGLRKSRCSSIYQRHYDRPGSDCTETCVRKSLICSNLKEKRDSDIYGLESKTSDIYENCNGKYDVSELYETVENSQTNIPDDVKVKMSDNYGFSGYVSMDRTETKRRKSASDLLNHENKFRMSNFSTMHSVKRNLRSHKPNTQSCHIKGDEGCIYARMDPMYIYAINPDCETGNAPPFVRTNEKTDPLPCFCPKNAWGTQRVAENEVFFSCEDIYVNFCRVDECADGTIDANNADNADGSIFRDLVDSTSVDDDNVSYIVEKFENDNDDDDTDSRSSGSLFKRKMHQLKRFLTDWS